MKAPLAIRSLALSVVTLLQRNSVNVWLNTQAQAHRHTLHSHKFTDCFCLQSYCDYAQNNVFLDYKLEVFCTYTTSTTNYIRICISKNLLYVNSLFSIVPHKMITLLNSMIHLFWWFFFSHFVSLQRISGMLPIFVLDKLIWGRTKKFFLKHNFRWLKEATISLSFRGRLTQVRAMKILFSLYGIFILWYQWDIPKSNWLSCVSYLLSHYDEICFIITELTSYDFTNPVFSLT